MNRRYFSYEEEQSYKEGRRDQQTHNRHHGHDRYSDDPEELAYFQGRKDEEIEQRRREEERMLEEMRENERMELEMKREYERYLQEQEYYDELNAMEIDEMSFLDDAESDLDMLFDDDEDF